MSVIKILLVDDFMPWQSAVREMLESEADFKMIGRANNGLEAVQKAIEALICKICQCPLNLAPPSVI